MYTWNGFTFKHINQISMSKINLVKFINVENIQTYMIS